MMLIVLGVTAIAYRYEDALVATSCCATSLLLFFNFLLFITPHFSLYQRTLTIKAFKKARLLENTLAYSSYKPWAASATPGT